MKLHKYNHIKKFNETKINLFDDIEFDVDPIEDIKDIKYQISRIGELFPYTNVKGFIDNYNINLTFNNDSMVFYLVGKFVDGDDMNIKLIYDNVEYNSTIQVWDDIFDELVKIKKETEIYSLCFVVDGYVVKSINVDSGPPKLYKVSGTQIEGKRLGVGLMGDYNYKEINIDI